ncbi:MAG: copper amine oxidase N-terminal domain-containing protein, partial [Bacillota bacterium]|nr:copper amine oxidase N-terminal domain-containing protein [Bacillota bacterium]
IEWDGALKQIKINHEGKTFVMKIGKKTYLVDNVSKTMDAAPEIVNGRTIVPLRFVSESVGYDVQWFEKDKKILISGKKDFMELGFRIVHEESIGSLALETEDKECVKIMGVADEKSEAVVTEADGLQHQTWYYKSKGTTLDMVRSDENKQIINSISVTKPCNFKTKRNIGIGSSRNDVLNAYGEFVNNEDSKNADSITLGSVYGGMILTLDKDVVTGIFIGAAAE